MDEFECITEIRRRLAAAWPEGKRHPDVTLGIGDDAAVLAESPALQVLSVDTLVEGVHFRRAWLTPADIGFRGLSSAASDLAAMGARPRGALCSFIVPPDLPRSELFGIADGLGAAARRYHMPILGGNLAAGGELSLTTTVIGETAERLLMRAGAQPGDALYITGQPGLAAMGLTLLSRGTDCTDLAASAACLARWRRPIARLEEGQRLRPIATSAIDVSDGLLQDLTHLCSASGVGARVLTATLPLDEAFMALARSLDVDGVAIALSGGEDYELLFTAPAGHTLPITAHQIGYIEAEPGIRVEDAHGLLRKMPAYGFRHAIAGTKNASEDAKVKMQD